jgi:hypothetical protein
MRPLVRILILAASLAGCSDADSPDELGRLAGQAKGRFHEGRGNTDGQEVTFMASWYKACQLARADMEGGALFKTLGEDAFNLSKKISAFSAAYVAKLRDYPGAGPRKPLQARITKKYWLSGTGCAGILKETPDWARR